MKQLFLIFSTLVFLLSVSVGLTAQEVNADDRVNIDQVNRTYIGVNAYAYQGVKPNGFPLFQLGNYGGTPAATTATPDGAILGAFIFAGWNGTARKQVAELRVTATGEFTSTATPLRMDFIAGINREKRMSILGDNGNVGIGTLTPENTLHLHRETGINYLLLTDASSVGSGLRLGLNGTGNAYFMQDTPNKGILFGVGGSASSVFDAAGNWGLGTTAPTQKLDVDGQIRMRSGATAGYVPVSDADGNMTWTDPSTISTAPDTDWLDNAGEIYRTGNAYMGTFTGADGHRLNVQNYIAGKGAVRGADQSGSFLYAEGMLGVLNSSNPLSLPVDVTNAGVYGYKPANGANGAAVYGWNNDDNSSNYGGVFVADGAGTADNYGIYAAASGAATNNYAGYFDGAVTANGDVAANGNVTVNGDGNTLLVGASGGVLGKLTVNAETGVEIARFRSNSTTEVIINASGNMGVGTAAPGAKLEVEGDAGSDIAQFSNSGGTDQLSVVDGRVGVRSSAPNYTFDVNHVTGIPGASSGNGLNINNDSGTEHWTLYNWSSGNLSLYQAGVFKGTFSEVDGAYTSASDRSLKNSIEELPEQMDKIMELRPTTYRFNDQDGDTRSYGLIAQEVREIYPELAPVIESTSEGAAKDLYGVTYSSFVPVLIKGMQEQQGELDSKAEEIATLQAENEELKNRLDKLEQMMTRFETDMQSCCFGSSDGTGNKEQPNTFVELSGGDRPALEQNAPNPFNSQTVIRYYLPSATYKASMTFTDMAGKVLKTVELDGEGFGTVTINANELAPGTYQYTLVVDGELVQTRQMVLTR